MAALKQRKADNEGSARADNDDNDSSADHGKQTERFSKDNILFEGKSSLLLVDFSLLSLSCSLTLYYHYLTRARSVSVSFLKFCKTIPS
jgi:hypothetical protein